MNDESPNGPLFLGALAASLLLLLLRLQVAHGTGFGDAEALYASYALHPQPAYLDHPGLIGSLARLIGRGDPPRPELAHLVTSVLATAVPWVAALASRLAGATPRRALLLVIGLAFTPELAIGLYGMTPDLPLALFWFLALGSACRALCLPSGAFRALAYALGAGVAVGFASLAKLPGLGLGAGLCIGLAASRERSRWATLAPWAALITAGILVSPVVHWELTHGFPMLKHRLISTQGDAGFSPRNALAFLGGQLAYVSPPLVVCAVVVARDLARRWREDAVSSLLFWSFVVTALPLGLLCLWSRGAEPHWFAPAYLPLALHFGRAELVSRRLARASVITGASVVALAWLWIKTPLAPKLLGHRYRPRYDLTNDLFAWQPGARLLERVLDDARERGVSTPVIVGPHWIVCAQIHARFGRRVQVGCNGPRRDDFDTWYPRADWAKSERVLYVHDSRFDVDPSRELPGRSVRAVHKTEVVRAGTTVRTIWVTEMVLDQDAATDSPALRIRSRSASVPGFGVVKSRSP